MRRAQAADILFQAKPGTGGPKSWPTAMSWRRVHRLIRLRQEFFKFGAVSEAARRIVVASEEGVRPIVHFAACRSLKRRKLGCDPAGDSGEGGIKLRQWGCACLWLWG
jgi:hypothetical protein